MPGRWINKVRQLNSHALMTGVCEPASFALTPQMVAHSQFKFFYPAHWGCKFFADRKIRVAFANKFPAARHTLAALVGQWHTPFPFGRSCCGKQCCESHHRVANYERNSAEHFFWWVKVNAGLLMCFKIQCEGGFRCCAAAAAAAVSARV